MKLFAKAKARIFSLFTLMVVLLVSSHSGIAFAQDNSDTYTSEQELRAEAQANGIETIDATITLSPSSKWEVGKPIKITVTTPNKGSVVKDGHLLFLAPDPFEYVEKAKTTKSSSKYTTTATYTPKKTGDYALLFSMTMKDKQGNEVQAIGSLQFSVRENSKIAVSLSPNTAYMKKGEELYLVLTYPMKKGVDHTVKWNDDSSITEEFSSYDEASETYKKVYSFKPEKAKSYSLEVSVLQEEDHVRREGIGKAKISVR